MKLIFETLSIRSAFYFAFIHSGYIEGNLANNDARFNLTNTHRLGGTRTL